MNTPTASQTRRIFVVPYFKAAWFLQYRHPPNDKRRNIEADVPVI